MYKAVSIPYDFNSRPMHLSALGLRNNEHIIANTAREASQTLGLLIPEIVICARHEMGEWVKIANQPRRLVPFVIICESAVYAGLEDKYRAKLSIKGFLDPSLEQTPGEMALALSKLVPEFFMGRPRPSAAPLDQLVP